MRLNHLTLTDHRNIKYAELTPDPHLTVLCGPNGQGKTNLLEAVWLLTGGKSFRGSKDTELIRRGCDFSVIEGEFETEDCAKTIRLTVGSKGSQRPGRTAKLNGVDQGRAAALAGNFQAVVFEPDLLSLVKGGPEGRRRFLDSALCQVYRPYLVALRRYTRLVAQKNALLKSYEITPNASLLLDSYNEQLAQYGGQIMEHRRKFIAEAGQEGGNTVADILSGKVNPSGKLPMTFPVSIADVASTKNFPDASGIDLKEMLAGFMGGGPEHTDRKNIDYTNYEEGIYVGYRYFDTFGVPVSYPFGYGQSYTTFNYSSLKVFMGDTDYSISCTITNNGPVAGKEVVQLYISAPGKSMDKPAKELRGFVKTQLLQPGESREIIFKVKDTDLASFDESASHWVVESGKYEAQIGSSADDIRLRDSFNVKGRVTEKVHAVLLPGERIDFLKR